jgi:exonuclease VII small subunit
MSQKESISKKIEKLKSQVEWFYGEEFDLTEAMKKYRDAAKLAKDIEQDLEGLKNEINVISEDFTR